MGRTNLVIRVVVVCVLLCVQPMASVAQVAPRPAHVSLPTPPCSGSSAGARGEPAGIGAVIRDVSASSSGLRCRAGNVAFALIKAADARRSAQAQGAQCELVPVTDETLVVSQLWVCSPYEGLLSARGGTTYGVTFLTSIPISEVRSRESLIHHEARHSEQWLLYGAAMPLAYARGGSDPCANPFEINAGLLDGGYQC